MFEGEQFHQFLVSSRTTTTLSMIPLSFPLDHSASPTPNPNPNPIFNPTFDFTSSQHQHQSNINLHHHHFLHHSPSSSSKLELQQHHEHINTNMTAIVDPWSANEVLALLRIRSSTSIDNWFPDFTWDLVSRKMGELGYKRSAENCKEKYEEETSTNLNGINKLNNKFLNISELEEQMFYQDHNADENDKPIVEEEERVDKTMKAKLQEDPKEKENIDHVDPHHPSDQERVVVVKPTKTKKRRSREDKFEMFKGFCVEIVNKMLAQQEDLHNKLIHDMVKRDEEKIERDEAWKKQEMERVNKEIEIRAHEQISVGERQATMIELLNKFTPQKTYPLGINFEEYLLSFTQPKSLSNNTENCALAQPEANEPAKKIAKVCEIRRKPLLSSSDRSKPENPKSTLDPKEDIGRRWPRDEVQALIDMRCSFYNGNINDDNKSSGGGSVWEKISQGMAELGYSRSSKRCKEKWENINKYFRKTKDSNKKRPLDSRTCPYFHQLTSLYNQGTALSATSGEPVSHSTSTENPSGLLDTTT